MAEDAVAQKKPSSWRILGRALNNRKTGFMLLFGFASGLPFALFLGTLFAWLTEAGVDLETMGVFSLIGLAYAFQFLWSPLIDKVDLPLLRRLGKRKQWIVPMQALLGAILVTMSLLDPKSALGTVQPARRARRVRQRDAGHRDQRLAHRRGRREGDARYPHHGLPDGLPAFLARGRCAGADHRRAASAGRRPTSCSAIILLAIGAAGLFAPNAESDRADTAGESDLQVRALRQAGGIVPSVRYKALALVGLLWAGAIGVVLTFMIQSLTALPENRPDPTEFTTNWGPWIIIATIVLPALIAGWLASQRVKRQNLLAEDAAPASGASYVADHLYRALVLPLDEFVGRLGWSLVLILAVVLTYRICDAIWGTFAYPFYLTELGYSKDEVAVASKFFGVGAIVLGLALGGWLLTAIGRMPTLLIGGPARLAHQPALRRHGERRAGDGRGRPTAPGSPR